MYIRVYSISCRGVVIAECVPYAWHTLRTVCYICVYTCVNASMCYICVNTCVRASIYATMYIHILGIAECMPHVWHTLRTIC